jgi:hypothetical protein
MIAVTTTSTDVSAWLPVLGATAPAVAAVIAAIIAACAASVSRRTESRMTLQRDREAARDHRVRDLESRNAARKFETYQPMIELLRKLIDPQQAALLQRDTASLVDDISRFSAWLAIFGSDESVRLFQRFMQCTYHTAPPEILLRYYAEFVLAARRDMGYPETTAGVQDILGTRVRDIYGDRFVRLLTMTCDELHEELGWSPPWQQFEGM